MLKKLKTRGRPTQFGIQKHKIRTRSNQKGLFDFVEQVFPSGWIQHFHRCAESAFYFYAKANCSLCLVPLILCERKFQRTTLKTLLLHYIMLSAMAIIMTHRFVVLCQRVGTGQLDLHTYICAVSFLIYLVTFSNASSLLLLPDETIELINGWPKILRSSCWLC